MESLRGHLRSHRTTRAWVAEEAAVPVPIDDGERAIREALALQSRITDALLGYAEAVAGAFEALLKAQTALEDGGIYEIDEVATLAKALLQGVRDAYSSARETVAGVQVPLEAHKATLVACEEDLSKADIAEAEVQRYDAKVDAMVDAGKRRITASARAEARLARNREKQQVARHTANVAKGCAQDAMRNCLSRQVNLGEFAQKSVTGTAEALHRAMLRIEPILLNGGGASPAPALSSETSPKAGGTGFRAAMDRRIIPTASGNPFSEDFGKDDSAENLRTSSGRPGGSQPAKQPAAQAANPFDTDV
jgi:hypothetical protein